MGAKESGLFRRGHANRHHVTIKINRKLVAVRDAWHLLVCGNQSFHGVSPVSLSHRRLHVEPCCRSGLVRCLALRCFKTSGRVAHGQQQNERKPKIIYNLLETNETILRFHGDANRSGPSKDQLTRARVACVACVA